jgi:hypothetical protein
MCTAQAASPKSAYHISSQTNNSMSTAPDNQLPAPDALKAAAAAEKAAI